MPNHNSRSASFGITLKFESEPFDAFQEKWRVGTLTQSPSVPHNFYTQKGVTTEKQMVIDPRAAGEP